MVGGDVGEAAEETFVEKKGEDGVEGEEGEAGG